MGITGQTIASVKIRDKGTGQENRVGQGADPYKGYVGAAALGGPLAAILGIAIGKPLYEKSLTES